jgi:hypothetical protein
VGKAFTFRAVCQPLPERFDAYGLILDPSGPVYSFDIAAPSRLNAGVAPLVRSIGGLPAVWEGLLFSSAALPESCRGRTYTFILGLVPSGAPPAVEVALPGCLWQGTVTPR